MDLTPEQVATVDAAYWATLNRIKLQKGVWDFTNRPYLVEPMQSRLRGAPRRRCFMKATQGGFSEEQVNESLWGLIHGYYQRGVMYLFPTTDDVKEFSKARFGPLIQANPTAIGQFVKDTDTVSLKKIGSSFLYLRGGSLTKSLEADQKESSKLRGISVDKVVFDEEDLMDPEVIGKALGRLGDSPVKEEVHISNPTLPGYGISNQFNLSDQRYWFRACSHCGQKVPQGADWEWFLEQANGWICAELVFPDCIKRDRLTGDGFIACRKCGKPVPITNPGLWVPQEPAKSAYMWGYHWSQLSSAANDPAEIMDQYASPPDGNLGDIVRLRLGKPFVSAEDRLTVQQVLSCCTMSEQMSGHPGPCAIGVDVRRHKNVVIGVRSGRERFTVLRVARVESWEDIHALMAAFHVTVGVVDVRPYEDSAREFQKKARSKIWLCEYTDSSAVGVAFNDQTGMVKVNRTEAMDATHRLVVSEKMLELPAICPEIRQFATECAATAKVQETNRKTKQVTFRYRPMGSTPDDYRHALNYFYLAASSGRLPVVGAGGFRQPRPGHAINEYSRR